MLSFAYLSTKDFKQIVQDCVLQLRLHKMLLCWSPALHPGKAERRARETAADKRVRPGGVGAGFAGCPRAGAQEAAVTRAAATR